METRTIFFDEKTKFYFIFYNPVCACCGEELQESAFIKIFRNKTNYSKNYYCESKPCVKEFQRVENSGQMMFSVIIVNDPKTVCLKHLHPVMDFRVFSKNAKMDYSESLNRSAKLANQESDVTIDRTKLANKKKISINGFQIGDPEIIQSLEKQDQQSKKLQQEKKIDEFLNNHKNSAPAISYEHILRIENV